MDFTIYLHTHTFIRNRSEPYLPLPSQPQLVLIYRPLRDRRPLLAISQHLGNSLDIFVRFVCKTAYSYHEFYLVYRTCWNNIAILF